MAQAQSPPRCVLRVDLDGVVHSAAASHLQRAVEAAEQQCQALLLVVDTPGGALNATRSMARSLLEAEVPVVTFVGPSGARAGSAGMFIVAAGHRAAMAPGTNIGAAHPVQLGGGGSGEEGSQGVSEKIVKDTAAFARAIGEKRGRNTEWLEKAVVKSASATAREALELGVIDILAPSVPALLRELDGARVRVDGEGIRLRTAQAPVRVFERTIQERALAVLAQPNVAYGLLMLGMLGLIAELYSPGLGVPGGVGVLSLLLAGIGLDVLPVRVGALVLLAVSALLFIAEIYVASFGLLALSGLGTLLLGSALLVDRNQGDFFVEPSLRVSWGVVIPLAVVIAGFSAWFAWRAGTLRRAQPSTGAEGLIGSKGRALTDLDDGEGRVWVMGERWRASSSQPVRAGQQVRVVDREGLLLRVQPEGRPGAEP